MLRRQKLFPSMPAATETADQPRDDRDLDAAVCCTCLDAPGFSPSASFLSVWGEKKACGRLSCGRGKSDELEKKIKESKQDPFPRRGLEFQVLSTFQVFLS